jgi:hypothetical protein
MNEPTNTAEAAKKQHEATRKRLAEEREARDKKQAEQRESAAKGKPTPTQAECDLAKAGVPVLEKEDDGSGPDPYSTAAMEPKPAQSSGGGYQTRQSQPSHTPSRRPSGET